MVRRRRFSCGLRERYERDLRRAGGGEDAAPLVAGEGAASRFAAPFVLAAPYAAAIARLPSPSCSSLLAVGGFFVPDLLLRQEIKQRREEIFLDLPELISVLALALGAGQSLRRALELAARDCDGPLAVELERALSLARRQQDLSEREALVQVARETGEPTFTRFAELLAAKESPYLDFLRQQARETRAEQARYLERAADRAYLAMHARSRRCWPCSCWCSPTAFSLPCPNHLPSERRNEMMIDAIWIRLLDPAAPGGARRRHRQLGRARGRPRRRRRRGDRAAAAGDHQRRPVDRQLHLRQRRITGRR